MKSEIDTVIEDIATKRIILFTRMKLFAEFMDIMIKKPNRKPANEVRIALSLSIVP